MGYNNKSISASAFIKSVAKFSVSSWINFVVGIASVMITTRMFSPDIYGVLNLFNSASNVFLGISCLGLDGAFIRFYNDPPLGWDVRQLLGKCLIIAIVFFMGLTVFGLFLFYVDISNSLFHRVSFYLTVLLSINVLSLMVLQFFSSCYRMANDARNFTIQSVLIQIFSRLFVVSAALISPTVDVVLTMNTIGLFILMIMYFFLQRKTILPRKIIWSFNDFGKVIKFAVFSWPESTLVYLSAFLIPFVITTQLDSYALGIYASAGFFVSTFAVIQSGFRTYWASFMYAHYKDEQATIISVHAYVMLFIILLLGGFILFQHGVYLLIGGEYHASRVFFTLVLVDPLLMLLDQTTNYGIAIVKKNHLSLLKFIIAVVINISGAWLLLPTMGIWGAVIASAFAAVVRFILGLYLGQRYYRSIQSLKKTVFGTLMILLLAISNCWFVNDYWMECSIVCGVFLLVAIVYIRDLHNMVLFIKARL
ncbi:lipopolysaccharide biosynthesis protein [Propionispira raffinosivorans]|uniref:lipopolysaccharide biosynthesis protein n=1 Tax=Propionispira raffinosivorans TaxID=86959 RepID=UPI00037206DD|nr:polysaccharide biosynthesis C-terminal domain-containing protein [Propionispira raffinosivorans]